MKSVRKRRLERKTDYKARFGLLKSGIPRLVVRKSNAYVSAQIVETKVAQDFVLVSMSTKDLTSMGWPKEKSGSLKSLPACYALGFKIGQFALDKGLSSLVLDFGMHRNIHKSRIYSVLKGVVDAGVNVKHSEDVIPSDELVKPEELKQVMEKIVGGKK